MLIIGCGDVGLRVAAALAGAPAGAQGEVRGALRARRGPRVLALTRSPQRREALRARAITPLAGDLDTPATLHRLAGLATRVVYLAPPPSSADGDGGWLDPRATAFLHALRRRALPVSLVYGSTTGVYGDCGGERIAESRPVAPATARARRRVNAERSVRWAGRRLGLRASILRIPGIYAHDRESGTPRARLMRGTPVLHADDDVYTSHIQADDLARACVLALWRGQAQRIYHASDDTELRMGDYFDLAADLYGLARPPRIAREQAARELPASLLSFMGESRRLRNDRLKRELGLRLRYPTVAEGLRAG